jgi:2'-5' RNA ligase
MLSRWLVSTVSTSTRQLLGAYLPTSPLYPFVPPTAISSQVISIRAAAIASVRAFDCRFASTGWFGQDVLWLDPEPDEPFRQLTAAIWEAFPQYPPYGGAYDDVVPHLTIAQNRLGDLGPVQAAERAVQPGSPLSVRVESLLLIAGAQAPSSRHVPHALTGHSLGVT